MRAKKLVAAALAAVMLFTASDASVMAAQVKTTDSTVTAEKKETRTASEQYVAKMGDGWNLGNSFDGFDTGKSNLGGGETAWGNPVVTKKLLKAVKAKGYESIRIPLTIQTRYSEKDGQYIIDEQWLARYKEVVDWAESLNLYVVVNIHHDSWSWLSSWNGDKKAKEYVMFNQFWTQIAACFKNESQKICFETINEPSFSATGDITAQQKLDMINMAAYTAIRNSGGNNPSRMIIIPTMSTNHEAKNSQPLYDFITSLKDPNIIATVHYYSEWVYSANLGKTGFDEVLWDESYTPRVAIDQAFGTIANIFTDKGIGVVIGEYGLLGYDKGAQVNQKGEELKYYDYINSVAEDNGICMMFWDNGSGIDRQTYKWKIEKVGKQLEACNDAERSSYATELDTIYFTDKNVGKTTFELTLNGNTFKGIKGLTKGKDYTYNKVSNEIVLNKSYIKKAYEKLGKNSYGTFADLTLQFSSGADWHEYLVKYTAPVFKNAKGTTDGLSIPVSYNGSNVRRVTAYLGENRVGPNSSWWAYLQNGTSFQVDYTSKTFQVLSDFFKDGSVVDGSIKFVIEFYDGQIQNYTVTKEGTTVSGSVSK